MKKDSKIPELSLSLPKGKYVSELLAARDSDYAYLSGSCTLKKETTAGVMETSAQEEFTVDAEKMNIVARCTPCDWGADGDESVAWQLRVRSVTTAITSRFDVSGRKAIEVSMPKAEPGSYEVRVSDPLTKESLSLGTIDLI